MDTRKRGRGGALLRVGAAVLLVSFVPLWGSCAFIGSLIKTTGAGAQIAESLGVDEESVSAFSRAGRAISRALEEITPEQEYYIGRAVAANIFARYKIWNDSAGLTKYLNEICKTIAINSPRPEIYKDYHVAILDSPEINAFASSGGHILITRGMIARADSEDCLAAVIAHEIGHIQLQHSIKAIKNSRLTKALLVTGSSAAGTLGNNKLRELASVMDESVNEIVNTLIDRGYSREQEFDADTAALALLAVAGYDPASLLTMLRILEQDENGESQSTGLVRTHPSPTQRIANVEKTLPKFKVPNTRSYRAARYGQIR
ncbi:MAG: M48 family metalloprotease [Treponema sp.]|jgi:predicted Zn-dependent protease|nr:M48 family metalloprotease [Treponema sp.]